MDLRQELLMAIRENCSIGILATEESTLNDIGIDSLALMEIIVQTEDKYGFQFKEDENIYDWKTVKDFMNAALKYAKII